jgi:hypothetical protein
MDRKWSAVRPSPLLVRLLALTALATAAALPFPALMAPALAFAGVVLLLAASDWAISRNDPAPQIERVLPTRLIKDRSATIVYRIRRAAATCESLASGSVVASGSISPARLSLPGGEPSSWDQR